MKKVKILSRIAGLSFSVYIAMVLSGCTGFTGPQGPQGATGADGPPGVSNIKMQVYTLVPANWKRDSSGSGLSKKYFYQDTVFNAQILDQVNDVVTAFYCLKSTMYKWQPLPAVGVFGTADHFSFSWYKYTVRFLYDSTANTPAAPDSNIYFNVAVIPPSVIKNHPNTNWKDGNAILQLPEMQAALQMKRNEL